MNVESTAPPSPARSSAAIWIVGGALLILTLSATLFGLPQIRQAAHMRRMTQAQSQLKAIADAAQAWLNIQGTLPRALNHDLLQQWSVPGALGESNFDIAPQWIDDQNRCVDPWGTPIALGLNQRNRTEARSAGPNQVMGDMDDLVREASRQPSLNQLEPIPE